MKTRLLLTLIACFLALSSWAADTVVDGIYYWVDSRTKTASVTYTGSSSSDNTYSGDITIPASIKYYYTTYSVTSIGESAFSRCTGLTSITIPSSVTSIGSSAFYGCTGLTSITIPESVTSIGNGAFSGCTGLTSITIPESVTSIGNGAFSGCTGLKSVTINSNDFISQDFPRFDNSMFAIGQYNPLTIFGGQVTTIILGDNVTSLGENAFYGFSALTSITIPSSVTSIGDQAFYKCTNLTSITIPNSVTSIGAGAFRGCTGLTSIDIPNSVTSIGKYAFDGCTGLTSIDIPNSVTTIGISAFDGCEGLTEVNITDIAAWCAISFGNDDANPLSYAHHLYLNGEEVKELTIPGSVTNIGDNAFRGCTSLTSITIPNSVTSIGSYAFYDCTGLTSITIPNSVTSIGNWAFCCKGLTSVTINSNDIAAKAYKYDSNLSNIFGSQVTTYILGDNVTSIGDYAFSRCTGLTSINIPNSVTSIGIGAFYGCTGLTSITIPSSVTSIGRSAFYGCTGLTSIDIPVAVTTIGSSAFSRCTGLTSITIGNSVTSIGDMAFDGCSAITEIYALRTDPAAYNCPTSAFNYYSATLHVPAGSQEAYSKTVPWAWFTKTIEEEDLTGIASPIALTPSEAGQAYYNLQGQRIAEPQKGIVIVRYSDGTSRKMYVR